MLGEKDEEYQEDFSMQPPFLKVKENQRQELKEAMQRGSRLFIGGGKARTI